MGSSLDLPDLFGRYTSPSSADRGYGYDDRDNNPADNPSLAEFELVQHIKDLFYRAREHRRPVVAQWYRNYQVLRNRTWQAGRPQHLPSPEVPEIYPILASLVGWMTDTQPQLDVIPAADPHSEWVQFYAQLAEDLDVVLDATWQIESYDAEIETALWDAYVYGIGWVKTTWDNRLHRGLGNAVMRRVDPFTFYPDPKAHNQYDANYFCEVRTMSLQDAEAAWPGAIDKLNSSGYQEDSDEAPSITNTASYRTSTPLANPAAISPNTDPRYGLPGQTDRVSVTDEPGVTIIEAWLRIPVRDKQAHSASWDTWRCVVVAANCVLADYTVDEMWSTGTHPYDRYVLHNTGEMYGFSMVELLTPAQLSINRLLAAIEQNIWLIGNPVFKEDPRGPMRVKVPNRPGARIPVSGPNGVAEWLDPPQMHPTMSADLIRFYKEEMQDISGLMAMGMGKSPGGRNAQDVLNSIQEAGFVRVRLALRSLERTLRSVGEKVACLVTEFYDTPRMVAMVGPNGQRTSLALAGKHFYVPSSKGRVPMRFQLLVQAGSALPTSRQARANEADTLYNLTAIDDEALLEAHNWPNRQQVLARVREQKMAGLMGEASQRAKTGRTS